MSANCAIEPGRVINYKPLLDKAIELSDFKVPTCIIYNRDYEKVQTQRQTRSYCLKCATRQLVRPMYLKVLLYTNCLQHQSNIIRVVYDKTLLKT